jgi:uncharacterized GH25 family protein
MKLKFLLAFIFAAAFSGNTFAHEYWFEAENFFPAPKEKTVVHLYVGDGIIKDREERAFQLDKTPKFELFSSSKKIDLKSLLTEGATPIYNFSADKTGTYLLAMERNWSYIKLEPQKFEDYLREDGIEYIIAERAKLGESSKEGRERYSRYLKSLLQVGDKRDNTYKKNLGMKLEIIPLENPYSKKVGDQLKFQILFDGKPLSDRTVFADNRGSTTQKMITDKDGKISVKIDRSGMWIVRLVNMQRCKADCGEADWESFWGAITFGI